MRTLAALACALACAGCGEMARQPRAPVYGRSSLFADGAAMQTPPEGAVSTGDPAWDATEVQRPPMTAGLIERGRERYEIYCAVCHDPSGYGQGIVPARGFPHPPSFHGARLKAAPSSHFVQVIDQGYGVMFGYGDRIPPADRWAIAAYVRALQLSQAAPVASLPAQDRARLEAGNGR